ncbi:hypothetical protein [Nocardia stercoris]|uniref:hypothetical protein n=1 Tax=Nocardia stercoris TaxID=2483361 RepID=UPI0011C40246|nr:hypothetical protein [Nocardia stercoris]
MTRGALVAVTIAVLAVAAHGAAGGGLPTGTGLTLLFAAAATAGAVATLLPRFGRTGLFAVLGGGQLVGHMALTELCSHHTGCGSGSGAGYLADLPTGWMGLAHLAAAAVTAVLIAATERLYAEVAQAFRRVVGRPLRLETRVASIAATGRTPSIARFLGSAGPGPRAPPVPAC